MKAKAGEVHPLMQSILNMHGAPLPKPNFHSYDPASSKEAAGRMELGPRARNCHFVLNSVILHPDSTARELACFATMNVVEVRRRLSDMDGRQVEKSGQRKCRIAGTKAVTWRAR